VHFPAATAPGDVGYKALAVNLSDLAAMAATPIGYSVVLATPTADPAWLAAFVAGLEGLAAELGVRPVAARRDPGPLAVTIEVYGSVPAGAALRRAGARPGDGVYVTGTLGDAALALAATLEGRPLPPGALTGIERRLARPAPRVAAGLALRGVASAAIDVSDGLAADLGHVLAASGVGATVELGRLPLSPTLAGALAPAEARALALTGGDDYELCFTAPPDRAARADTLPLGCPVTRIGTIEAEPGLRCRDEAGRLVQPGRAGYQHFRPGA
jgi:thiamine-monophosphate kinase